MQHRLLAEQIEAETGLRNPALFGIPQLQNIQAAAFPKCDSMDCHHHSTASAKKLHWSRVKVLSVCLYFSLIKAYC